jgi:hypothetical protein
VEKAFPRFGAWELYNECDDSYAGFCVWGSFDTKADMGPSRAFFVTFDTAGEQWRGHLTIGKHCYYWSSADVGDAHLIDTEACATLEQAIIALRKHIGDLTDAFLASDADADAEAGRPHD